MLGRKDIQKVVLILFIISLIASARVPHLSAEIRGLWVMAWDLTTPQKIDHVIDFAKTHNFNQIFAHVRYRADALYTPNRIFDTYPNEEPRSYILADDGFDPLAYLIDKAAGKGLEIHAWVTVFVITPRVLDNLSSDHLFYQKNEWLTKDFLGNQMAFDSYEGAYLDPGIPETHDYLINVFLDILSNYQVKGIQLDYIRYPDSQFGYNPLALENYARSQYPEAQFHQWRSAQIDRFVRRFYSEVKHLNPEIIVSAAVISDLNRARTRYSQNWTGWLENGYLDYAYTMSYSPSDDVVKRELESVKNWNDRIIVGLRAWTENNRPYSPEMVSSKIAISNRLGFSGIALFSYSGVKQNNNSTLTKALRGRSSASKAFTGNFIFGYLKDYEGNPLPNLPVFLNDGLDVVYSDENGFYLFNGLKPGKYWLRSERDIHVSFSGTFVISGGKDTLSFKHNFFFP